MLTVIAAVLVLATVAGFPPIGFRFQGPSGTERPDGVAVQLRLDDRARADLFVENGDSMPRWRWVDGADARGGIATLRARGGARALLVVRRERASRYELDGPFAWPASEVLRVARPVPRRTLSGARLPAGRNVEMRLVGRRAADALCEIGAAGWQCPAVPSSFTGRIVACDGGRALEAGDVRPDLPDAVVMRRLSHAGSLTFEPAEAGTEIPAVSVQALRLIAPGSAVLGRDRSWSARDLGEGLVWIEGSSDPAAILVEARAQGFATARIPFSEIPSVCSDPVSVALAPSQPLAGDVIDSGGTPVAGAVVLVRSVEASRSPALFGEATTAEDGSFELEGLELRRYRLRACHAEAGCGETTSTPAERVTIALSPGATFSGRVLTSAGVPEPGASVRILPGIETWVGAPDRLARLPLQTTASEGGRFSIVAPDAGDYLLEVRGAAGGLARLAVRSSPPSPSVTDLGDVRLSEPVDLAVRVARCAGGILSMSGPLGGETSLPGVVATPLDTEGAAGVRLSEGGTWAAWANCGGKNVTLEPGLIPDVALFAGIEVRFEPGGSLDAGQSAGRSK